eukprot:6477338-Amphidinium_carterae.2
MALPSCYFAVTIMQDSTSAASNSTRSTLPAHPQRQPANACKCKGREMGCQNCEWGFCDAASDLGELWKTPEANFAPTPSKMPDKKSFEDHWQQVFMGRFL